MPKCCFIHEGKPVPHTTCLPSAETLRHNPPRRKAAAGGESGYGYKTNSLSIMNTPFPKGRAANHHHTMEKGWPSCTRTGQAKPG